MRCRVGEAGRSQGRDLCWNDRLRLFRRIAVGDFASIGWSNEFEIIECFVGVLFDKFQHTLFIGQHIVQSVPRFAPILGISGCSELD